MWGPGRGAERFRSRIAWLAIDGEAGTPITEWNGDPAALEWVSYDVTALPYTIRQTATSPSSASAAAATSSRRSGAAAGRSSASTSTAS